MPVRASGPSRARAPQPQPSQHPRRLPMGWLPISLNQASRTAAMSSVRSVGRPRALRRGAGGQYVHTAVSPRIPTYVHEYARCTGVTRNGARSVARATTGHGQLPCMSVSRCPGILRPDCLMPRRRRAAAHTAGHRMQPDAWPSTPRAHGPRTWRVRARGRHRMRETAVHVCTHVRTQACAKALTCSKTPFRAAG
jgi:hypothetical protein